MKKNRKVASFLLASATLMQTLGCAKEDMPEEKPVTVLEYTEDREEHINEINDNEKDIDDIILTYLEQDKNISKIGEQSVATIFEMENENASTDEFHMTENNVEQQVLGYANTSKPLTHSYSSLYNTHDNSIKWENVSEVIYQNSKTAPNDYVALSESDTLYVTSIIKDYITKVAQDFPNLDMAEIACKLENLSLYYGKTNDAYDATSTPTYIVYFNTDQNVLEADSTGSLTAHELGHFLCFGCTCQNLRDSFSASGININTPESAFDENQKLIPYHLLNMNGLSYRFIEEVATERLMYMYYGELPERYYESQAIVDNIEFVLSLDENHQIDQYVENCLYHEPIEFIQQFPVGLSNTEENFTDNVRMLSIYDALLVDSYPNNLFLEQCLDKCQSEEEKSSTLGNLITYSQSQLSKLFFTNLITVNEAHPDKNNIPFYAEMVHLFEKRMNQANELLANKVNLEDLSLVNDNYQNYYQKMLADYINYLGDFYQDDKIQETWEKAYRVYNNLEYIPDYVSRNSLMLYANLESASESNSLTFPRLLFIKKEQ